MEVTALELYCLLQRTGSVHQTGKGRLLLFTKDQIWKARGILVNILLL